MTEQSALFFLMMEHILQLILDRMLQMVQKAIQNIAYSVGTVYD